MQVETLQTEGPGADVAIGRLEVAAVGACSRTCSAVDVPRSTALVGNYGPLHRLVPFLFRGAGKGRRCPPTTTVRANRTIDKFGVSDNGPKTMRCTGALLAPLLDYLLRSRLT